MESNQKIGPMSADDAYNTLRGRTDVRVSRADADRALMAAQTGGYYGIEYPGGKIIKITFVSGGFCIEG